MSDHTPTGKKCTEVIWWEIAKRLCFSSAGSPLQIDAPVQLCRIATTLQPDGHRRHRSLRVLVSMARKPFESCCRKSERRDKWRRLRDAHVTRPTTGCQDINRYRFHFDSARLSECPRKSKLRRRSGRTFAFLDTSAITGKSA